MAAMLPSERLRCLSAVGGSVEIKKDISPIKYFRSGIQMESLARAYAKEGDLERAYKMLHKFITLFIEKLPQHPSYSKVELSKKKEYLKKVDGAFALATDIKHRLSDRYHSQYQVFLEEQKQNEMTKSNEVENSDDEYMQDYFQPANVDSTANNGQLTYRDDEDQVAEDPMKCRKNPEGSYESSSRVIASSNQPFAPNPEESYESSSTLIASSNQAFDRDKPAFDRSLKPAINKHEIAHAASDGLRNVRVPDNLSESFLTMALSNTASNIETCGILSGHLVHERFEITHVIIPKQHGTADSCTTEEEEEIFDVQDSRNLITLGWIHTHPSQTSFLSSVDLHTQYSYQMMMPEAIAIVCAPSYRQTGYYTLTRDHGLNVIGKCKEIGFHPHPSHPVLFEDCRHVFLDSTLQIQFIDLRSH